jgi:ribonuclease P/MRP protein subunit POP5
MKRLPSLRKKKRYIGFELLSDGEIREEELSKEIVSSAHSLFGDLGVGELALRLIEWDGRRGAIRCRHDKTAEARSALAVMNSVGGKKVGVRVLTISGTIRGIKEKLGKV